MTTLNTASFVELPKNHKGAANMSHEKEMVTAMSLIVDHTEIVTVRWYMGKSKNSSVVYCSVWTNTEKTDWKSGRGVAKGYGYHKGSAAFQDALSDAGIELSERVDGVGDTAILDALHAIGDAMGYPKNRDNHLIVQHG